jgi:hypothetical protein
MSALKLYFLPHFRALVHSGLADPRDLKTLVSKAIKRHRELRGEHVHCAGDVPCADGSRLVCVSCAAGPANEVGLFVLLPGDVGTYGAARAAADETFGREKSHGGADRVWLACAYLSRGRTYVTKRLAGVVEK